MSTTNPIAGSSKRSGPVGVMEEKKSVIQALGKDGVARVGTVLTPEQVTEVKHWLEARESDENLVQDLQPQFDVAADGQRRLAKLRRLFWSDPQFWSNMLVKSRILDIVGEIIGPSATLLFHTGFLKPGGIGSEMTLHQDQGVTPWDLPYVITMWIAITPSRTSNGCIIGYPGSHRNGLIPHVLNDGTIVDRSQSSMVLSSLPAIEASRFADQSPVHYELEPGEAAVWHHFFVHGSAENRSGLDRKGIALVFADASRPGYTCPDYDFSGRKMEPMSVMQIRQIAAKSAAPARS